MIPRGIRNNNPGNIRKGGSPWMGKKPVSEDLEFEQFYHPRYGIRAIGVLLRTYQRSYGLESVVELISRYAPNSDNNTASYVRNVARQMEVSPTAPLDLSDNVTLLRLMLAIIRHENNGMQPYLPVIINEAFDLMGA